MLSDTVNGVLEVSWYDNYKDGRQEQRQNFIQLLSGEGAESGKQRYTVQYQNLRVDFDIELCTSACPLSFSSEL